VNDERAANTDPGDKGSRASCVNVPPAPGKHERCEESQYAGCVNQYRLLQVGPPQQGFDVRAIGIIQHPCRIVQDRRDKVWRCRCQLDQSHYAQPNDYPGMTAGLNDSHRNHHDGKDYRRNQMSEQG